jgi:hypothetical protein
MKEEVPYITTWIYYIPISITMIETPYIAEISLMLLVEKSIYHSNILTGEVVIYNN